MTTENIYAGFAGRIVMVGFGSIGQGALPLLLRHLALRPQQIQIVTADEDGAAIAAEYGIARHVLPLTPENYRRILEPRLAAGDFLVNTSNDVSSHALMALCLSRGALYIDTCIEPWPGGYTDPSLSAGQRSNYALREAALRLNREFPGGATAILTHGANPGLVSHFVKQALLECAVLQRLTFTRPGGREDWAALARALDVRVIHIAERDTQVALPRKQPGEFVNTWSVEGFVGEGCQPAELGWGSHERHFPADGRRHEAGCKAAIYLERPGASVRVRTWTPLAGPIHGFLITHGESVSLADYLTVGSGETPDYRPTVHYAYHPCDDAVLSLHELAGRNWRMQETTRIVKAQIVDGRDELGVLLMGPRIGAYWYGSRLSIQEARAACPHNGATSLQVTAPLVAGVIWALEHPREGIIDPEALPHDFVLDFCRPYLGEVGGVASAWTPLEHRGELFAEDLDTADPWQFKNFRVV